MKLVKILVRLLAFNKAAIKISPDFILRFGYLQELLVRLLMLKVGLTVQVFSLDVRNAFRDGTIQKEHVTREEFVFTNFDYATDFDLLAAHRSELVLASDYSLSRA